MAKREEVMQIYLLAEMKIMEEDIRKELESTKN